MNAQLKPDLANYRELLLGCGHSRLKRLKWPAIPDKWVNLTTHDMDGDMNPDYIWNLNDLPYPWESNSFDEVHCYEVLEHCGTQGDAKFFFDQFAEFYRILKPGGYFCLTVPMWDDPMAWGVPDHKRVMPKDLFVFLDPRYYNFGEPGAEGKADYRYMLKETNFRIFDFKEGEHQLAMVLEAIK